MQKGLLKAAVERTATCERFLAMAGCEYVRTPQKFILGLDRVAALGRSGSPASACVCSRSPQSILADTWGSASARLHPRVLGKLPHGFTDLRRPTMSGQDLDINLYDQTMISTIRATGRGGGRLNKVKPVSTARDMCPMNVSCANSPQESWLRSQSHSCHG